MPEGQERGRRFSAKQSRNKPNPPPHLPLPGHPLPQGERESKRLFMLPVFLRDDFRLRPDYFANTSLQRTAYGCR
ncbi:hypothetical protein AGMMS50256_01530 [Betaproteobacteria bacterium]|nr:hypothetical protein AGMMS50256_01530 [Betaproteobacteria bacterium]